MENQGASLSNAEADLTADTSADTTLVTETKESLSDGITTNATAEISDAENDSILSDSADDIEVTFADTEDFSDEQTDSDFVSGTVEVTDTLQEILNQNVSVSGNSEEILPQKPDNSDIEVTFED